MVMKGMAPVLAGAALGSALIVHESRQRRREMDLEGRTVLVTGGSRGLGFLLAREFLREGARVVICARDPEELERARLSLENRGQVATIPCDVGRRDQVEEMVSRAVERFGAIDVLVNNAGVAQAGPVQMADASDFEFAMDVMFWGVLHPSLAVLPSMIRRGGGRIVNVTSIGGRVSVPHVVPYCCAKFAAVAFSEGLRAEMAGTGVKVVTVTPGLMRTGSYLNALFKGKQGAEFMWFGLSSALPLLSTDAERAARQIVRATKRGEAQRTITVPANVLARFHGFAPGFTADLLGLAHRYVLPGAEGGSADAVEGSRAREQVKLPLFDLATAWGRHAAERFQQHNGHSREATEA